MTTHTPTQLRCVLLTGVLTATACSWEPEAGYWDFGDQQGTDDCRVDPDDSFETWLDVDEREVYVEEDEVGLGFAFERDGNALTWDEFDSWSLDEYGIRCTLYFDLEREGTFRSDTRLLYTSVFEVSDDGGSDCEGVRLEDSSGREVSLPCTTELEYEATYEGA